MYYNDHELNELHKLFYAERQEFEKFVIISVRS